MITQAIYITFFVLAFVWSCVCSLIQIRKLIKILKVGTNGNQRLISVTFSLVSFANGYFQHIIILSLLTGIFDVTQTSMADVYVLISLLIGSLFSISVSLLLLSEQTVRFFALAKNFDTDGHRLMFVEQEQKQKQGETTILGVWAEDGMLDLASDFKALYQNVSPKWRLLSLYSEYLKFEDILNDTRNETKIDIFYFAAHCDGRKIILNDEAFVEVAQLARFAQKKSSIGSSWSLSRKLF